MKPYFNQFRTFNLKGSISRANDILICLKEMQLSNDDAKALARAQNLTNQENGDMWEAIAWEMVWAEIYERQIRIEDPTVEVEPDWNGGFKKE